jgi:hypothetical protein
MFYSDNEHHPLLYHKLQDKEHFVLNRFGEGEIRVLIDEVNTPSNTVKCVAPSKIKEWEYNPKTDQYLKQNLYDALYTVKPNYLIATLREGWHIYRKYIDTNLPSIKKLATNYFYSDEYYSNFYKLYLPLFLNYKSINFICSDQANYNNVNIRFNNVWNKFNIFNAWKQTEYTETVVNEIASMEDSVFIFAVGFNSKIIIKKAYDKNPNNVYYDFGAHLDQKLYNRKTRGKHIL